MNKLMVTSNNDNLTSLEILEQINIFRKEENNRAELQHCDLLKVIRNEFEEEISLGKISESEYVNSRGKTYPMFILTLSQAKQILLRESKFVRKAVIHYIEQLEDEIKKISTPTTYLDALKALIQKEEKLLEANTKLEVQAPKVEYHDKVLNAHKLLTTTNIAKDLGISARKLNEELHNLDVIYKQSNVWLLYARYQHMIPEYADYHITEYGQQLKWTEKGRQWIIKMLNK